MANITIRNIDGDLQRRLRVRAAEHNRSVEEEAREIPRHAAENRGAPENLGEVIHRRFAAPGGAGPGPPPREPMPEPPRFGR